MVSRAFRARLDTDNPLAFVRGEARPDAPLAARWGMGQAEPADVVWTTHAYPLVVSDRVIDLLRGAHVSGWDVMPLELRNKTGKALKTHHLLTVHGRCGPVDEARSHPFVRVMRGGSIPWVRGLFFEPSSWDGSDIFMPEGRVAWIFVVDKVKEVLERAKVRNVLFTSLDTVERMRAAAQAAP